MHTEFLRPEHTCSPLDAMRDPRGWRELTGTPGESPKALTQRFVTFHHVTITDEKFLCLARELNGAPARPRPM